MVKNILTRVGISMKSKLRKIFFWSNEISVLLSVIVVLVSIFFKDMNVLFFYVLIVTMVIFGLLKYIIKRKSNYTENNKSIKIFYKIDEASTMLVLLVLIYSMYNPQINIFFRNTVYICFCLTALASVFLNVFLEIKRKNLPRD